MRAPPRPVGSRISGPVRGVPGGRRCSPFPGREGAVSIEVDHVGKVTILRPQGDVLFGRGDVELREVVREQLEAGHRLIVLDLTKVRVIDSAGLGELVASLKRVREKGGALKIFGLSQRVSDALLTSRLVEILDIYESERDALASLI